MTKDRENLDPDLLAIARALGRYQAQLDLRQASADAPAEPGPDDADNGAWLPSRWPGNHGDVEMGCMTDKMSLNHHRTFHGGLLL